MKALILLLLFSLTAVAGAGKKIVDLNVKAVMFDLFFDEVVINKSLFPGVTYFNRDFIYRDGAFLYFENKYCKLFSFGKDRISGSYNLLDKNVYKHHSDDLWTVAIKFNNPQTSKYYNFLICKFPSNSNIFINRESDITTDHITNLTNGLVTFD